MNQGCEADRSNSPTCRSLVSSAQRMDTLIRSPKVRGHGCQLHGSKFQVRHPLVQDNCQSRLSFKSQSMRSKTLLESTIGHVLLSVLPYYPKQSTIQCNAASPRSWSANISSIMNITKPAASTVRELIRTSLSLERATIDGFRIGGRCSVMTIGRIGRAYGTSKRRSAV